MIINIDHEIGDITLKPGEMFTIWLDKESDRSRRDAVQVELRVRPDGVPEIFTHKDKLQLKDFSEYVSI